MGEIGKPNRSYTTNKVSGSSVKQDDYTTKLRDSWEGEEQGNKEREDRSVLGAAP